MTKHAPVKVLPSMPVYVVFLRDHDDKGSGLCCGVFANEVDALGFVKTDQLDYGPEAKLYKWRIEKRELIFGKRV